MKQIKLPLTSLLVLATALVLAAGTPAFAHEIGSADDSTTSSSSGSGSGSNSGSGKAAHATTVVKTSDDGTGTEVETHHSSVSELKQKSQTELAEHKQGKKAQTDDQRKKVCEARKQGLTNRSTRIVTNSKRIQARIDGILQKATDYKTDKNLDPTDWDALVAAAETAKENSSTSIANLESVEPTVDCNNVSVASDVATFKAAAAETRDNLKAYRDSVKAVLKSLAEVKKTTTEGSN
jgi:hypothetical protein